MAYIIYAPDGSIKSVQGTPTPAQLKEDPQLANYNGLSGTGTPSPNPSPALPSGERVLAQNPTLPSSGGSSSSLLSFANGLEAAVALARKNRNAASLNIMAPYRGTAAASDFNGILNNLNTASDKTSSDLVERATKLNSPEANIITSTSDNGDVHGINKDTGEIVWTAKGVGNKQSGGTGISSAAITSLRNALNASKFAGSQADGKYADPTLYLQNYQSFIASGGSAEEFFKNFPPSTYVNPDNTWLPEEIMKFAKKSTDVNAQIDSLF